MNKILPLVLLPLIICSCNLLKKATTKVKKEVCIDDADISIDAIRKLMQKNRIDFQWMNYKSKLTLPENSGLPVNSVTVHVRIKRDSIIWISVNSIRGEEVRILASHDSVQILNKPNRQIHICDYSLIESIIPIRGSYKELENFLSGDMLFYNSENLRSHHNSDENTLVGNCDYIKLLNEIHISKRTCLVTKFVLKDKRVRQSTQISYSNYQYVDSLRIPLNRKVSTITQDTSTFLLEIQRIKINEPANLPFRNTDKFEKAYCNSFEKKE